MSSNHVADPATSGDVGVIVEGATAVAFESGSG